MRTDACGLLEAATAHAEVLCALVDADRRPRARAGVAVDNANAEVGAVVAASRHGCVAQAAAVLHMCTPSMPHAPKARLPAISMHSVRLDM